MAEAELEISKVWINPTKAQHHPDIGFAPQHNKKDHRPNWRAKNCLSLDIGCVHQTIQRPNHASALPVTTVCFDIFARVCPHYHYHNETWSSAIGRKISPRYVSFGHLGEHNPLVWTIFSTVYICILQSDVWTLDVCAFCLLLGISPILKTDSSVS